MKNSKLRGSKVDWFIKHGSRGGGGEKNMKIEGEYGILFKRTFR
jgi:hypothetical protein